MSGSWISRRGPGFWIGAILFLVATIVGTAASDAINGPTALILMASVGGLLYPLMRSSERCEQRGGIGSPATSRYNRGMMAASMLYLAGMGIAVYLHRIVEIDPALMWAVAFLPILPIFAMIWVMGRYIAEEDDEFLRHRAIMAALGGLALLLAAASLWGFLEQFELVAHAPGWWSVPIWALGMGVTRMWLLVRDREGEDA